MKSPNSKTSKENKLMDEFIISIFYNIDNFCKKLKNYFEHYFIPCDEDKVSFEPPSSLSLSEIMAICICFHLSGYRTFKWYYIKLIQKECCKVINHLTKDLFGKLFVDKGYVSKKLFEELLMAFV